MTIGQSIAVFKGKKGVGVVAYHGKIVIVERRYIVVQYPNYRESFQIVDVENNIEHDFILG